VQGFSREVKHDRKATSNNLYHLADSIRMPDFDFRQRDWYLSYLACCNAPALHTGPHACIAGVAKDSPCSPVICCNNFGQNLSD
jgi:hypothetical protein